MATVTRFFEKSLPVHPGQTRINDRHKLLRNVGPGQFSDTSLVEDEHPNFGKYLAATIFTLDGMLRHSAGELHEREFLKKVAACENSDSLPVLRDNFLLSGPRADHLCFVMDLLSTAVSS